MMRSLLVLGLAGAFAGCANGSLPLESEPDPSPSAAQVTTRPGDTFRLRLGDTADVRIPGATSLVVTLREVAADSRCPSTALVLCVWAGDAEVMTGVATGGGSWSWFTLHTTLDPKSVAFNGYTVTLVELSPYPKTTDPIDPASYVASFRVDAR